MAKSKKRGNTKSAAVEAETPGDDMPKRGASEGVEAEASPTEQPPTTKEKPEVSESRIKIRPRFIVEKEEDSEEKVSGEEVEKEGAKRMAWPSKDPFQAKVPEPRVRVSQPEPKSEVEGDPVEPVRRSSSQKSRSKKPPLEWSTVKGRILSFFRSMAKRKAPLIPMTAAAVGAVIFFSWLFSGMGYDRGQRDGRRLADEAATREKVALPDDVSRELDEALNALRSGDAEKALQILRKLEEMPKGYASLSYLVALAAMQNGDIDLAEQKVKETIAKRERVSDALALESVLVTQKAADLSRSRMGDPRVRSEALLRQAAIADAANPYPRFELATLLRYKGQLKDAAAEVRAAQARLNPMDSHVVMDVTLQLIELEQTPDDQLPAVEPDTDDVRKLLPFAYAAMRRGEFPQAVAVLTKCRGLLSPDLFDYLVNDPAFRRFARQEELKGIYGN